MWALKKNQSLRYYINIWGTHIHVTCTMSPFLLICASIWRRKDMHVWMPLWQLQWSLQPQAFKAPPWRVYMRCQREELSCEHVHGGDSCTALGQLCYLVAQYMRTSITGLLSQSSATFGWEIWRDAGKYWAFPRKKLSSEAINCRVYWPICLYSTVQKSTTYDFNLTFIFRSKVNMVAPPEKFNVEEHRTMIKFLFFQGKGAKQIHDEMSQSMGAVSYTHLTLPTKA